jgi:hypothetical protein
MSAPATQNVDSRARASFSQGSSTVGQCKLCGDKRCKCCLQLQHAQVFHSKMTGKEYKIFCNVNCKTPNVVYLLDCHVSRSQYVGESVQPFNKRMNGHRSDLMKRTLLPVSQHFVSPGHSLDDFGRSKIYIIDHNPSWKEIQWLDTFLLRPTVKEINHIRCFAIDMAKDLILLSCHLAMEH